MYSSNMYFSDNVERNGLRTMLILLNHRSQTDVYILTGRIAMVFGFSFPFTNFAIFFNRTYIAV